jgi:glutamate synthase (ferredoxin)
MSGFPSSRAFTRSNIVMRALPNSASTNDFYITHNDRKPAFLADLRERDACGVGFIANLNGIKSNKVLQEGLQALSCNEHRGGCNFDKITGDGAGIMTQIPWKILHQWAMDKKLNTIDENNTIVGTFFLEQDGHDKARMEINKLIDQSNFELIGWREVPVDDSVLGPMAKDAQPKIFQLVIKGKNIPEDRIEAMGYILRKKIQIHLNATFGEQATSVVSFSSKTIVYKGMLKSDALKSFYKDLSNPDYETQFSIYHRRFSTNTMPRWSLAQPMKILGHNGEINTYLGNLNWEESRENSYESVKLGKEIKDILPIIDTTGSDSYALD